MMRLAWKQEELESMARQAVLGLPDSTRPRPGMKRTYFMTESQSKFFGVEQYEKIDDVVFLIAWDEEPACQWWRELPAKHCGKHGTSGLHTLRCRGVFVFEGEAHICPAERDRQERLAS